MVLGPYNSGSISALRLLSATALENQDIRARLTSGFRIADATSNSAYWAISTRMKHDVDAASTVNDGLQLSLGVLDTACQAVESLIPLMSRFNELMIQGQDSTSDREALAGNLDSLRTEMLAIVQSASFNGVNLLYHKASDPYTQTLSTSVSRSSSGQFVLGRTTLDLGKFIVIDEVADKGILSRRYSFPGGATIRKMFSEYSPSTYLIGLYDAPGVPAEAATMRTNQYAIQQIVAGLINAGAVLGALKSGLEAQVNFTSQLSDIQNRGIGRLIDADMNEESARMKALEAMTQIGMQALSVANSAPEQILHLFR